MHRSARVVLTRSGVLALLVALAVLPRLPILLAAAPDLYRSGQGGSTATSFIGEELHRGTTALHWLEQPLIPCLDYQFVDFHGGSLVGGLLAMPFFAALGPNLVALKASNLPFTLAAILLAFACLDRLAGRRAAWIGAVLLAGSPPGYSILSLTAYGTHVEGNALSLAAVYAYLRAGEGGSSRSGWLLVLGLIAGFGLFFVYTVALTLAVLVAHRLLVVRGRLVLPDLLRLGAGLVVGLSPWLWINLNNGLSGVRIYGGIAGPAPAGGQPESWSARVVDLVLRGFPESGYFTDMGPVSGVALGTTFALAGAAGFAALFLPGAEVARSEARRFDPRCLVVAPLLFVVIYGATRFGVGDQPHNVVSYRYVYVLAPTLVLALAWSLDRLAMRGARARRLALAATIVIAGTGMLGGLGHVDPARLGEDLEAPGYSNRSFGRFIVLNHVEEPDVLLEALERARPRFSNHEWWQLEQGVLQTLGQLTAITGDSGGHRPAYARLAREASAVLPVVEERVAEVRLVRARTLQAGGRRARPAQASPVPSREASGPRPSGRAAPGPRRPRYAARLSGSAGLPRVPGESARMAGHLLPPGRSRAAPAAREPAPR